MFDDSTQGATMESQVLARDAYNTHLSAAQAIADDDVLAYRLDVDVAVININHAMRIFESRRADISVHLPRISLPELESLPSLALAVKMAAINADNAIPEGTSAKEMITEGWALRKILMPVVKGFAVTGHIPEGVYKKIASNRGVRDMADDCVALAQVFYDYQAAIAGKHPVEPATITRAEVVGSWLSQNLSKHNAAQPVNKPAAVGIRDRMATLLVNRYNTLRVVAFYFHGEAYGEYVPALMSRQVSPKPEPAPESTAPAEPTPEPSGE
jgi:hypothetical protein